MRIKISHIAGMYPTLLWLLIAIMTVSCLSVVRAADDDFFLTQDIDVRGVILGTREADFNGDGLIDLAVFAADASGNRLLQSYIQREAGRFPPSPSQTFTLSPSANVVQCLDLDGDNAAELYVIDHDGLWRYRFEGGRFNDNPDHIITVTTIFGGGIENGMLPEKCFRTVSGRTTAFLPDYTGFALWSYTGGKFTKWAELPASQRCAVSSRPVKLFGEYSPSQASRYVVSIPDVVVHDGNGDGRDDIYFIWPDRLTIYMQDDQGRFGPDRKTEFRFQDSEDGSMQQSQLVDYDGDGRLDLICSRSDGGISGAHTDITFFNAADILLGRRVEGHRITLTDACGNLIVGDFNNDGNPELAVPAVELGILSTVQKMITKKTDVHVLIYPIDNYGRPSKEPTVRRELSCRLDFEQADPTADIRLNWAGDYDGDGLADLVVADGGGQLMFYRGLATQYIESKASLVLDMPSPNEIRPTQLNNDGRDDLVIIHKPAQGTTRLTLLVTNRIS